MFIVGLASAAIGHPHLLFILRGKDLDAHIEVEELASVDISRLEQATFDGEDVKVA